MAGIESAWSSISEDLILSIVKLLPARIDILRLRAVCSSFRSTIPHPPTQYPFPQSILSTTDFLKGPNPNANDVFNLTTSTNYAIEPLNRISHTQDEHTPDRWLVKVHESNSGRVRITDPMTGEDSKDLSEKLPKSLNLLDYRVTEIGKFYALDSAVGFSCTKVVFSSFLDEHDDEFAIMAIYDDQTELGMWRNVDQKWSHIDEGLLDYWEIVDIIYYNDKFYALLSMGRTVTVDPKSLIVTQVAAHPRVNGRYSMEYLVGSFNDLFLVVRHQDYDDDDDDDEDKYYIGVFKLNEKKRKWVLVMDGLDFEDRVLFVGDISCLFSVSVNEFLVFKGPCDSSDDDSPGQDTWIWDFNNGALEHISVFPGYLNCFWPPPAWLNDRQELTASDGEEKQRRSS